MRLYRRGNFTPVASGRVCVRAQVHVTRDEFFTSLPAKLLKLPGLTKAHGIPTAKVPILDIEVRARVALLPCSAFEPRRSHAWRLSHSPL